MESLWSCSIPNRLHNKMRAVILLALLGAAFAVPRNPQRIVGGEATTIEQYPHNALMQYNWWGIIWSSSCGGSIITNTKIVTAAHCVVGDSPSSWRAILGTTFANSGGTIHTFSQIVWHQGYSHATLDNDVAVATLSIPAVYSHSISPIPIAGPNYNLNDDSEVVSTGWGTLYSGGPASNTLQHVSTKVINQEICAERYAHLKTLPGFSGWPDITDGMLCAGILDVGGKDACQGDSGGPLTHQNVLVGITSWGYGCAHETYPGVNARVSHYTDWILANSH